MTEKAGDLLSLLDEQDAAYLDHLLYLRRLRGAIREKEAARSFVAAAAERWSRQYWDASVSAEGNALALGVKRVRTIRPAELPVLPYRAFYDASASEIRIFSAELDNVLSAQEECGRPVFSRPVLTERLIAHEVFHHLESQRGEFMDSLAASRGAAESRIWRDIGANAFANAALGSPPNQLVDLIWMMKYAPAGLSRALEELDAQTEGDAGCPVPPRRHVQAQPLENTER